MRQTILASLAGLAHCASDAAAGLVLGQVIMVDPIRETGQFILLYNLLAFGFQPLVGWLIDRWPESVRRYQIATMIGLLFCSGALICCPLSVENVRSIWHAVLLMGVGSAAFHAGGGGLTALIANGRFSRLGFFTAPGAIGLAAGFYLADTEMTLFIAPLAGLLTILAVVLAVFQLPDATQPITHLEPGASMNQPVERESEVELIGLLLLLTIALRSAIWNVIQIGGESGDHSGLLLVGLAATVGKLTGGLLADLLGWRKWVWLSLPLSAVLLAFGQSHLWLVLAGIALLQSVTPIALRHLQRLLPELPATASGLGLGLGVLIGALPIYLNLTSWLLKPIFVLLFVSGVGILLLHSQKWFGPDWSRYKFVSRSSPAQSSR